MKLLLMADGKVGFEITKWLIENYCDDIGMIVTISPNNIYKMSLVYGIKTVLYSSSKQISDIMYGEGIECDLGLTVWWPYIIKQPLINELELGFINTHPSLLPHNRGKHPNFWAIVEEAPFGVSLHMAEEKIDAGDIIAQTEIPYTWEDNGKTLYERAERAIIKLFIETYPAIRTLDLLRVKQDTVIGSYHNACELDSICKIDLDKEYNAKDLLNLLRARTFEGHPACWFVDKGKTYEVRIGIEKKGR